MSSNCIFKNTMQVDLHLKFSKVVLKSFHITYAFGYQDQMISWPFHSTSPPEGIGAASSVGTTASVGPTLATVPVMPSITLMSTTIQQCINNSMISQAIT